MASSAFRTVRELRGDEIAAARPGTSSGSRNASAASSGSAAPSSSSSSSALAAKPNGHHAAQPAPSATSSSSSASEKLDPFDDRFASLPLEEQNEDLRLALDKEKRANRALEQYVAELTASHEAEVQALHSENNHLRRQELEQQDHTAKLEAEYKDQVLRLQGLVERWQRLPDNEKNQQQATESFAEVMRDEMHTMQKAYELKLGKALNDLSTTKNELQKQIRTLNENLIEERRRNNNLVDRLNRGLGNGRPMSSAGSRNPPSQPTAAVSSSNASSVCKSSDPSAPTSSSFANAAKPIIAGGRSTKRK